MTTLLAAIDGQDVLNGILWVIVVGIVFWLLTWLVSYIGLPEPFAKIARVILAVAAVLFLINVILSMAGHPMVKWD